MTIRSDDNTRATTRLYLITPPAFDPDRFAGQLKEALAGGDVACLQLRLKDVDEAQMRMVNVAKDLANKGEIMIANKQGEDELVY